MEKKGRKGSGLTAVLVVIVLILAVALIAVTVMSLPAILGTEEPADISVQVPAEKASEPPTETPTEPEPTLPPPEENPFDYLDFQYEGRYLKLRDGVSVTGIDVSHWQKEIDWEQVKASGVEFAMIRLGYRGYELVLKSQSINNVFFSA